MIMMIFSSISFLNMNSNTMFKLVMYHDKIMSILIFISILVGCGLIFSMSSSFFMSEFLEDQILEFGWTFIPAIILLIMAIPSMMALYFSDEWMKTNFIIKIIGHQWYWSYEYNGLNMKYDSFMKLENSLTNGEFRNLETSISMLMLKKISTQLLLSSFDVIHAWTIPVLGVKMDAMPGRLSQMTSYPLYTGVFFGQCSEICGANHSFMPIKLEII